MKFSIITASKNGGAYLEDTIKSVISQKDVNLEYIIIDSASKDNTLDVIEKYVNDYPIKLISEPDDGISDAFNKGVEISEGDWIIFLGSGDLFIHPNVLKDMSKKLKSKSKSLVVWGNIIFINNDGDIGKLVSGKFPKSRLKRYMCMPHQATFTNRTMLKKYGLFDEKIKYAMDYDILLRCYHEIREDDYIDYDVAYMLIGGNSQQGDNGTIKDFRDLQIEHKIWPTSVAYLWYYWAILKNYIKDLINHDTRMKLL